MIRYKRNSELDDQDIELIRQLAEGKTVKEIAQDRGIVPSSLNYQVRKIFSALGATRIPHMVHIAWQRGILRAPEPVKKEGL